MEEIDSLVEFIENHITVDETSWELENFVEQLPTDDEDALGDFCDKYELGNWFYEALQLRDIDIKAELESIIQHKRQEEHEAAEEQSKLDQDLRISQGGYY